MTPKELRYRAVERLSTLWKTNIRDPEESLEIDKLFLANGWAQHTPYQNQPGAEYCGHTVSYGFQGEVDDVFLKKILASTTRLADKGPVKWSELGYDRDSTLVQPGEIQPGDIVVVKTSGKKPWGDHIILAYTHANDVGFGAIEGNAFGVRGDGSWGKGVIRRSRFLKDVRQVIRLDEQFISGGAP